MSRSKLEFHFWAMAALGKGLSGGDRIFIELARRWSKKFPVTIYVWEEGFQMLKRQHLGITNYQLPITNYKKGKLKIRVLRIGGWSRLGFVICYFLRIVRAVLESFKLKLSNKPTTVVYSASHFWMDSLPALVLKLRFPKITWAAAWYQTAPSPLRGFAEGRRGERHRLRAFLYWLSQIPIKPLVKRYADFVLVNNEEERKQFPALDKKGRTIVVLGAVPLLEIENWKLKIGNLPKVHDAVFQGRFHPQKGVVELIDIWKKVVEKKPEAKLAMIGDGPLMKNVKSKIKNQKLERNVKLFGYVFDGPKKYKIFSQSKIVVHPAFYDSGGMASAEAMAFGLPCVGFNLKAYESYYPQGMVKVRTGDLQAFADEVIRLLEDQDDREKIGKEALDMIEKNYSWDKRAGEALERISNN